MDMPKVDEDIASLDGSCEIMSERWKSVYLTRLPKYVENVVFEL